MLYIISYQKNFIEVLLILFSCRVMCKCGSCGSRKQTLGEWERHTGCRAKKWKYSVKVKSTMLPLEKWVCMSSCSILEAWQISAGLFVGRLPVLLTVSTWVMSTQSLASVNNVYLLLRNTPIWNIKKRQTQTRTHT